MFFLPGVLWWFVFLCAYPYGCELPSTPPPTGHQDPSDQPGRPPDRVLRALREELQLQPDGDPRQGRGSIRTQRSSKTISVNFVMKLNQQSSMALP